MLKHYITRSSFQIRIASKTATTCSLYEAHFHNSVRPGLGVQMGCLVFWWLEWYVCYRWLTVKENSKDDAAGLGYWKEDLGWFPEQGLLLPH